MPEITPPLAPLPAALLHNPALRTEVTRLLEKNWPHAARSWPEVWHALSNAVGLPPYLFAQPGGKDPTGVGTPPARFQPELLDGPNDLLKAVVKPLARPALLIRNNDFEEPTLEYWKQRLDPVRDSIKDCITAVARVELENHDLCTWNGTAWLVRPNVAVTNGHVARVFAVKNGAGWTFRTNSSGKQISARLDFRQEHRETVHEEVAVTGILYVAEEEGPDLALLQIQPLPEQRHALRLATQVNANREIVTIGYPSYDGSVPDPDILASIFAGIFDVKRLSPGLITKSQRELCEHDCSTLGGSSGSAVIGLDSGEVLALHFAGIYHASNFALPAPLISRLLTELHL